MLFGWIPIVGQLLNGFFGMFSKAEDVKIATITGDTEIIQARAQVAVALKDDPGIQIARDLIMIPVAVWTAAIVWDSLVISVWPAWTWVVYPMPASISYLPYAVIAFLFVSAWRK